MIYAQEPIAKILADGADMMQRHWEEIKIYDTPLNIDHDKYATLENAGMLWCLGVRDNGKLIAYAVFIVTTHLHYAQTLFAMNDAVFVEPSYRKSGVGVRLFKACEERLKKLGVCRITWHIKTTNNWVPMMERLGYRIDDIIVSKEV